MAKRRRFRRIAPEIYEEIRSMVQGGCVTNAAELTRYLETKFTNPPSERTVRDVVRELLPPDPSGPWQPGPDDDPEKAARVLEAWAAAVARSKGQPKWRMPSRGRARWIAWIRAGWPDLDPVVAVVLATDYWARRASGKDTADLDAYLAFTPWRSTDHYKRWQDALEEGLAAKPPLFYFTGASVAALRWGMEQAREMEKAREGGTTTNARQGAQETGT